MHSWYRNINIRIRWAGTVSEPIPVQRGTRQGGLTSPYMFNLFYQDLIERLSKCETGITIAGTSYNVFCFADDVLIASTTATGLQHLIDTAVQYIVAHRFRFNPNKTVWSKSIQGNTKMDHRGCLL